MWPESLYHHLSHTRISFRFAAKHGIVVINPDTSPRGFDFPGEHDSYDFGSGAGFYVNATEDLWKNNYRMYSYITGEVRNNCYCLI